MTKRFYKDAGGWYIDLPELIANGTFAKGNLAMVAGADTMLDILSKYKEEITIKFEDQKFKGWQGHLVQKGISKDEAFLESIGHPVEFGGDYVVTTLFGLPSGHELWLCGVCAYLFNGIFPKNIYIKIVKK